jgi:UTP--glucose-1-phosphate uridylyltransferase
VTTSSLAEEIAALPAPLRARLDARGFEPTQLVAWAARVGLDKDGRNRLSGAVLPPQPGDLVDAPVPGSAEHAALSELGLAAIRRGELALCVLAGGMATRMGGVVKALVDALPGRTFLDLRLAENAHWSGISGQSVPLWLMTSEPTNGPIQSALAARGAPAHVATFEQFVSLRITPEGRLFRDDQGEPSVYATGHGDLPDALRKSGLLASFRANGGRYVWIANIDNLGATIDPALLGAHIRSQAQVSVELVDKVGSDRGGGPVRWNGRKIIVEEFRLPLGFDPQTVPVFNTNTFLVSADALAELTFDWTYVEVEKKAFGRTSVQFERLIGELTVAHEPQFLRVPRDGTVSRFLPVKDTDELERRRGEIEAMADARRMLGGPAHTG